MFALGATLTIAAAVGCTKLPPPTPLAELNAQQKHGYDVYQERCASCHNDRTNDPLNGQSLRGVFKKQYLASGAPANADRVMDAILYGRAMMPALGNTMTPQERTDLLAYMHTL
jgi:mono/diheme cytochrome c family protein